jgi:hypothetical protein
MVRLAENGMPTPSSLPDAILASARQNKSIDIAGCYARPRFELQIADANLRCPLGPAPA